MISSAKQLVKEGHVKQLSPTLFQVLNHQVKIQVKKGRNLLLCSCQNSSYFGHNNFCSHSCAAIIYLANKDLNKRLNESIKIYEQFKKLKKSLPIEGFINELRELRGLS